MFWEYEDDPKENQPHSFLQKKLVMSNNRRDFIKRSIISGNNYFNGQHRFGAASK
jgi:hypothetical protein